LPVLFASAFAPELAVDFVARELYARLSVGVFVFVSAAADLCFVEPFSSSFFRFAIRFCFT